MPKPVEPVRYNDAVARLKKTGSAEICARISRLARANLTELEREQIKQRVGRLIDGYATRTLTLQTNALFRTRKLPAEVEVQNVSEIWYPPAELVQRGRFNWPNDPVFYASNRPDAALWEIRPQPGDRIALAVCGTVRRLDELKVAHIGMGQYRGKAPLIGEVPILAAHNEFLEQLRSAGVDKKWLRIDSFLADLATLDEVNRPGLYTVTCEIADFLLKIPNTLGLFYPSIATGFSAFNVRLNAQAADDKIFVSEIWEMEMLQHRQHVEGLPASKPGYGFMKTLRRSERIEPDGSIVWAQDFETDMAKDDKMVHRRIQQNRLSRFPDAGKAIDPFLENLIFRRYGAGFA